MKSIYQRGIITYSGKRLNDGGRSKYQIKSSEESFERGSMDKNKIKQKFDEQAEETEEILKNQRSKKDKPKMKVSGKSILELQRIIKQKCAQSSRTKN